MVFLFYHEIKVPYYCKYCFFSYFREKGSTYVQAPLLPPSKDMKSSDLSYKIVQLSTEHMSFANALITSNLYNPLSFPTTLKFLLNSVIQQGKIIGVYYNNRPGGYQLSQLLQEHINIAAEIIVLAGKGQPNTEPYMRWKVNAYKIGYLLSNITGMSSRCLSNHMLRHLKLIDSEIKA